MNHTPVTDLLRQRLGLDPEALGPTLLPRVLQARLEALGLSTAAEYAARLAADPNEFQTLLGAVTVPETWFFRGGDLFARLAQQVAEAVRARPPGGCYRVLSLPCSTGEEPYSLAIALAEAGVASAAWSLDGMDVNAGCVERARRGIFGEFSFRQTRPELRQRYFRPVEGRWELVPYIRSLVRFRQGNLFDPGLPATAGPFDLIFCRNLFIYLHPAARRRALDTLDQLLAPAGLLCTGHAEPLEFLNPRFERTGIEQHFVYRRRPDKKASRQGDAGSQPAREPGDQGDEESTPRAQPTRGTDVQRGSEPVADSVPVSAWLPASLTTAEPVDLLAEARGQADRGLLDEALATCKAYLARSGPSVVAYGLMGVLHQARRERDEAMRCFRRALYLEPGDRDALTHLMLICQEQGDHAEAARLQRRLQRAAPGGEA